MDELSRYMDAHFFFLRIWRNKGNAAATTSYKKQVKQMTVAHIGYINIYYEIIK